MDPKQPTLLNSLSAAKRAGASLLLLLYLFALTPVSAEFTALIGATDRSHHVTVEQTATGIQVVLRHGCAPRMMHQHGLVARALTLLAQQPAAGHPDHVIQFACGAGIQAKAASWTEFEPDALAASLLSAQGCFLEPPRFHTPRTFSHGPLFEAAPFLLGLRSTVLLI